MLDVSRILVQFLVHVEAPRRRAGDGKELEGVVCRWYQPAIVYLSVVSMG